MRQRFVAAVIALGGCAGAFGAYGAAAQTAPKPTPLKSTAQQRTDVTITVYNQNFGLVREIRDIDLANGRVALEFRDVSGQIRYKPRPSSLHS